MVVDRIDGKHPGILAWQLGDRSLEAFWPLLLVVRGWQCFLYITDGWPVYAGCIDDGDHLVSKTAMYRVEGENTRLRQLGSADPQEPLLFQVGTYAQKLDSFAAALSPISRRSHSFSP